ncbi:MAG: hypothetical protein B7Z73_06520, partial [Planctomycetia bacterium 21-64-5]
MRAKRWATLAMRLRPHTELLVCLALAIGTLACYQNVLKNGFVNLDDPYYVTQNVWVQRGLSRGSVDWAFTTTAVANWHPLTWLSLELDYELFGLKPAGFHATNLALHVANTLALYWLLRRWTGAIGRSACAAAFFALHPLHVESVAWVTERKDVLSTLFLLFSLLAWGVYARRSAVWAYAAALVLFVLSLMAKPMGVTLPLLLLLLDVWPLARRAPAERDGVRTGPSRRLRVLEKLPFFLASAASAAMTLSAQSDGRTLCLPSPVRESPQDVTLLLQSDGGGLTLPQSLSWADRLRTVPVSYVTYLRQTFWPTGLTVFYHPPGAALPMWKSIAATAVLTSITVAVWRWRASRPYLAVGWCWFLISLLPVIGRLQAGG